MIKTDAITQWWNAARDSLRPIPKKCLSVGIGRCEGIVVFKLRGGRWATNSGSINRAKRFCSQRVNWISHEFIRAALLAEIIDGATADAMLQAWRGQKDEDDLEWDQNSLNQLAKKYGFRPRFLTPPAAEGK